MPTDVEWEPAGGKGFVKRANETLQKLAAFHDADLASYNALLLCPPCPADWKPQVDPEAYKAAAQHADLYDPKELEEARRMICQWSSFSLEPLLECPTECLDDGDLPFWETAMSTLPRPLRPAAARKYWLFPLFHSA